MAFYARQGDIPRKRHSVFRDSSGRLMHEQLVGVRGFVGISSLLYHQQLPTTVLSTEHLKSARIEAAPEQSLRHRHFRLHRLPVGGSPTLDRTPLFFNSDLSTSLVRPDQSDEFFYRNAQADELVYVTSGQGVLETQFGSIEYRSGDYLVIPRSVLHRFSLGEGESTFFIVESRGHYRTPDRYRNEHGQMLEGAPFNERDIRTPQLAEPVEENGEFPIVVKQGEQFSRLILDHHPFDVVGWDGYLYPWAFSIHDFEPLVGRFHQPPPIHQTFANDGFVVCSFCPRPYDFDPQAVPAPYHHTNIGSDEILYYVSDEFMSRKGTEFGSMTLHPDGLPHGPQPGRTEASIGAQETDELAVMVDTFRPVNIAASVLTVEDEGYTRSWVDTP